MGRRGAIVIAGLALLVSGCGGSTDEAGGSDEPAGSPSPPSSETTTPSETSEPSEPTPTVEPASGLELETKGFRVNAPEKWRITNSFLVAETAVGPVADGRTGAMLLGLVPSSEQVSLAAAMRESWKPRAKPPGLEKQSPVVLGGLSAFYYTAPEGKLTTKHVMGNWDSGWIVELNIGLPSALPPERQREIVDAILATYRCPRDG